MVSLTRTPNTVWRDYNTDGEPGSGAKKPVKGEIRTLLNEMVTGTSGVEGEVQGARDGHPSLGANVIGIRGEVEGARDGEATLGSNVSGIKATAGRVDRGYAIRQADSHPDWDAPHADYLATWPTNEMTVQAVGLGDMTDDGFLRSGGVAINRLQPAWDFWDSDVVPIAMDGAKSIFVGYDRVSGFLTGPNGIDVNTAPPEWDQSTVDIIPIAEDADRKVILGFNRLTGTLVGAFSDAPREAMGYINSGTLMLWCEGFATDIPVATEAEVTSVLSIEQTSTNITALCSTASGKKIINVELSAAAPTLASGITKIRMVLIVGQSLAEGWNNDPVVTPTALNPGRALMFNGGVRFMGGAPYDPPNTNDLLNRNRVAFLDDLVEVDGGYASQTVAATLCDRLLGSLPADEALLVANGALGASSYAMRKKGTATYRNLLLTVERGATIARMLGCEFEVSYVVKIDGESDSGSSQATWLANMYEEHADLNADIKFRTGQAADIVVITDQMGRGASPVVLAQIQAAKDQPTKFVCVGPKYHLEMDDSVHLTALGYAIRGAEFARAIVRFRGGTNPLPPYISAAVRAGAVITCTIAGDFVGPMMEDSATVTDPGNKGVIFTQTGGNSVTILSTAISSGNLIVTLSDTPTGTNQKITIGRGGEPGIGPVDGPRACFRDQSPDTVTIAGSAHPLHRWIAHCECAVTT